MGVSAIWHDVFHPHNSVTTSGSTDDGLACLSLKGLLTLTCGRLGVRVFSAGVGCEGRKKGERAFAKKEGDTQVLEVTKKRNKAFKNKVRNDVDSIGYHAIRKNTLIISLRESDPSFKCLIRLFFFGFLTFTIPRQRGRK